MPRRYLGRHVMVGYCQRSDFKVPQNRLHRDGEMPGLLVREEDCDLEHPQKYPVIHGPDHQSLENPAPPVDSIPRTLRIGTLIDTTTWEKIPVKGLSLGYYAVGVTVG